MSERNTACRGCGQTTHGGHPVETAEGWWHLECRLLADLSDARAEHAAQAERIRVLEEALGRVLDAQERADRIESDRLGRETMRHAIVRVRTSLSFALKEQP